jgi:chromosome partitioning protein
MTIYLFGSSKGGVGKSTFAVNAAAWLALHGSDTLLIDTDVQRHASAWIGSRRAHIELPQVDLAQAYGKEVSTIIQQHAQRYDDLVIDAGGRDSYELRGALRVCDVVLVPIVASQFDLYSLRDMSDILEEARLFRPDLAAGAFLNKVSTNWALKADEEMAFAALVDTPSLTALAAPVHLRRPFATSVEDGRGVFEMGRKGDRAADEFAALWAAVEALAEGEVDSGTSTLQH